MLRFNYQRSFRDLATGALAALGVAVAAGASLASDFPNQPVRLLVGAGAGSGIDTVSRILAEGVSQMLPRPMIVENKPGAGGTIAGDLAAKAPPDGHTLVMAGAGVVAINPHLMQLSYKADSFSGVTLIGQGPMVMIVSGDSPIRSLADLIEAAKAKPNSISYGTPGLGTGNHLVTERLALAADIKIQHIPYRGPAANMDLVAGRIHLVTDAITTAMPFIKDGRVRAIAVTTAERAASLPDVPTIAEQGFKDFDAANWYGVFAPKGTPRAVIDKLNSVLVETTMRAENKERLANMGFVPVGSTPEMLDAFVAEQAAQAGATVKAANLKLQ